MPLESQTLLEVLQYLCLTGLILGGIAALILPGSRKKAAALLVIMVFVTILSFIFYAGILIFIVNMSSVFVFAVLYLLARSQAGQGKIKRYAWPSVAARAAAVIFCAGLGYAIFYFSSDYLPEGPAGRDIDIASLNELTEQAFSKYHIIIIMLAAAALVTYIGFTVWYKNSQGRKEV